MAMKKTILLLCILAAGSVSALAQGRHTIAEFREGNGGGPDTVRAVLAGVMDVEKVMFRLAEDGDTLKVQLGGKPKLVSPAFCALDVRPGDTLTVAGVRTTKKKLKARDPEMVSATILSHAMASDHHDQPCYPFSLDVKPSFQGGDTKTFSNWVTYRLVYPEACRLAGNEGTCRFKFTIDKTGKMVDIELEETSGYPLLDAEAYRVIASAPAWTPGSIHGEPVKVVYHFPVIFKLVDPKMSTSESMRRR